MNTCENVVKSARLADGTTVHQAKAAVYSSPYANLRESVATMKQEFSDRVEFYDPVITGLIGCPELYEITSEQIDQSTVFPDTYVQEIEISNESATVICSGFFQSMKIKGENTVLFSDRDGQIYSISCPTFDVNSDITRTSPQNLYQNTDSGRYPLLTFSNGAWKLNTVLLATNFVSGSFLVSRIRDSLIQLYWTLFLNNSWKGKTALWLSQRIGFQITGSSYSTIHENVQAALEELGLATESVSIAAGCHLLLRHFTPLQDRRAPLAYVTDSLLDNTETCSAYLDTCDALLTSKPALAMQSLQTKYKDAKKSSKKVILKLSDAFRQGGFRGVVNAIIAFFKGGETVSTEDGVLTFTDNDGLLPQEFIAGILSTVFSALASIVSLLVSIFSVVVGVILAILATVFSGLFKSITSTHSDTYASITSVNEVDDTALPCHPFALFANTVSISDSFGAFLLQKYYRTLDCSYFGVPGGYIFFGPGEFDNNGGITKMNWEFHPYSGVFDVLTDESSIARPKYAQLMYKYGFSPIPGCTMPGWYQMQIRHQSEVIEDWCTILSSDEYVSRVYVQNETSTGHLNAYNDKLLRASVLFNIGWFLLWIYSDFHQSVSPDEPEGCDVFLYPSMLGTPHDAMLFESLCLAVNGLEFEHNVPFWTDIISLASASSHVSDIYSVTGMWQDTQQQTEVYHGAGYNQLSAIVRSGIAKTDMLTSQVIPLPSEFYYDTLLPRYNGGTYWKWLGLAAAITAAVAVTSLVVSVKVKQAMKKKRASNKARFDDAQAAYNNALNGEIRDVQYNEETGKWEEVITKVDPDSQEGQALINSTWKQYKKTARNNNLWQHIIGGSRYDVSTFWGEAEEPSEEDSMSFNDKLSSLQEQEEVATDVPALSQKAIQDTTASECLLIRNKLTQDTQSTLSSLSDLSDKLTVIGQDIVDADGNNAQVILNRIHQNATALSTDIKLIQTLITGVSQSGPSTTLVEDQR